VIASVLGLLGAAAVTAFVLKRSANEEQAQAALVASSAPSSAPSSEASSAPSVGAASTATEPAPTAELGAAPEALPSASADAPPASSLAAGRPPPSTGGPFVPGKPRPDSAAAASASAAAVDPAAPGSLQVLVQPWGDVSVDGKAVGTTPLPAIQLAPGTHLVVVKNAELGATRSTSVTIKPGQTSSARFDLRRTE
jgi:serine/threonine-protein kinase